MRAAYGGALLAAPGAVLTAFGGRAGDDMAMVVARVLGTRHLLQALAQRSGALPRVGALIDTIHAATMFALAASDGEHRSPAMIDGSVAAAMAGAGLLSGRGERRS